MSAKRFHTCRIALAWAIAAALVPEPASARSSGPVTLEAIAGAASETLEVLSDTQQPDLVVLTPAYGSVIAGNATRVTGTLADRASLGESPPTPVYGEVLWTVREYDTSVLLAEGSAPVVDGRFTINEAPLGVGDNLLEVFAVDGAGLIRAATPVFVTVDPNAPAVTLISPPDGSAHLTSSIPIDLNFSAPVTLVSVNGVPDGRELGPGIVDDAFVAPLEPGANPFLLEFQGPNGTFQFSFTLFRVESLSPPRITSIAEGAFTNQLPLEIRGTVALGTPYLEVNGVSATIEGAEFSAMISLSEGSSPITAAAYYFLETTTTQIRVTLDTIPPRLLGLLPSNHTATADAAVRIAAQLDEPARVEVVGPAGSVEGRTRAIGPSGFPPTVIHRAELDPLPLADGPNDLVVTATDRAGNPTVAHRQIDRADAALVLVSPADGSEVAALRVSPTVQALADVTLDALFAAGRRVPAFEGAALATGQVTLQNLPLAPGANEIRIVYHREGGSQEVVSFAYQCVATDAMTVTGTVKDRATGAAVGGALASIQVNGITLIAVTGTDGRYSVAVEPGQATVVAMAEGYTTESTEGSGAAGDTVVADVDLDDTGIPGMTNQVAIVVPPEGTVTDFEKLTVVGTVHNPQSTVTVNGIAAEVIGHRFTARSVPLAMGANTLTVNASALGSPGATASVNVQRATEPVLAVKIFSPPAGATIPGSGLVIRGFVSASAARTFVNGGVAPVAEGVFELTEVFLPDVATNVNAVAQTQDELQAAEDLVPIVVASETPALLLDASPATGDVPLTAELSLRRGVPTGSIERIDFDTDGDGTLDVLDSLNGRVSASYPEARPITARAFLTTAQGVELSARASLNAHLPSADLGTFAQGNPVDLARAPGRDVYVLDAAAATVSRYTLEGAAVSSFGVRGSGPTELLGPQSIAVRSSGEIVVADTGNDRIQVFASDGTHQATIGEAGSEPGQLRGPRGVAVDGDTIYVSDTGNDRVQVFVNGRFHASIPLSSPRGLTDSAEHGVVVSTPTQGLFAVSSSGSAVSLLDGFPAEQQPLAPVDADVAGFITVADAGRPSVDILAARGRLMRRLELSNRPPMAVLATLRGEIPSVWIADGMRVRELSLPVPSPIPMVESLKDRLASQDVSGALELIWPLQRDLFEEIYTDLGDAVVADAAAMEAFTVDTLTEDNAIVRIHTLEEEGGQLVPHSYPVHMIRAEDGTWQIFDY